MAIETGLDRIGRPERGDVITASMLRKITAAVLQKITVVGGRVVRSGNSLSIDVRDKINADTGAIWHNLEITAATQDGSNYRWEYTVKRTQRLGTGHDNYQDHPDDTQTYTAYNTLESSNGSTGTYGNGVSQTAIDAINDAGAGDGTFELVNIPTGTPIIGLLTRCLDGTIVYEFMAANGVTGACPEAS